MKKIWIFVVLAILASAVFAASGLTAMKDAMKELCRGLRDMLPVAAMLMIILAGVIYAAGQMMGAETRSRANVWATAALTGALIAILIAVIAPAVLNYIYGGSSSSTVISSAC
jgi:hypothetical protein